MQLKLLTEHAIDVPLWVFDGVGFFDPIRDTSQFPEELVEELRGLNRDWETWADEGAPDARKVEFRERSEKLAERVRRLPFVSRVEVRHY
jgi:hypothetical protein